MVQVVIRRQWYLRHDYLPTGRGVTHLPDFVGPFGCEEDARRHAVMFGPVNARLVNSGPDDPRYLLAPGDHMDYMKGRI